MSTVLAIDQGTSGTKAVVVDAAGAVRGLIEHPVRPRYLPGGGVEQDPAELLDSVLTAGRAAVAAAGLPIDAVTLANQGETVLAWDPDTGRALSQLIVWQDRRAAPVCTELAAHGDTLARRTGLVLDPYFSAPKQVWLRRNVTRAGVVTTSDSWLLHRLTGAFVTDAGTASRSLLTDLDTAGWDRELLALFELADEPLPAIVGNDAVVGETTAFGGPGGGRAVVGGLALDQQAALLGTGCLAPGEAKCTFGTGAFLLANTGPGATRSRAGLAASVAWQLRGATTYCLDGQVYAVASAVRWLQQLGFVTEAADLDRVAAPDPGGVLAVPALAGLGAPRWRPDARASLSGMGLDTGVGQLVTAVLQGIGAQVAELADAVAADLGRPLTRLRVDGGLTRCATLMQAVADIAQLEIEVFPSAHATPLGAAGLARMALDPDLDPAAAVPGWTPSRTHTPRWPAQRAAEFRARWADAAARA